MSNNLILPSNFHRNNDVKCNDDISIDGVPSSETINDHRESSATLDPTNQSGTSSPANQTGTSNPTSPSQQFIGRAGVVRRYHVQSVAGVLAAVVTVNFYEFIMQHEPFDRLQHPIRIRCRELGTEVREVTMMLHPLLLEDCAHYQFHVNDLAKFSENDQMLQLYLSDYYPGFVDAQILGFKLAKVRSVTESRDGDVSLTVQTFGMRMNRLRVLQEGLVPVYSQHVIQELTNLQIDEQILQLFHSEVARGRGMRNNSKPSVPLTSSFFDAICVGHLAFVTHFLRQYPQSVDDYAEDGQTGLIKAIIYNRIAIIRVLIQFGARVRKKGLDDRGPIHYAVVKKNGEILDLLRDMDGVNDKDAHGCTALHMAVKDGQIDIVEKLLSFASIDVNVQDDDGNTPVHRAINFKCQKEIVEMLVNCDGFNPILSNGIGLIPLHYACFVGFLTAVRSLTAKFPEAVDFPKEDGVRALHVAAFHCHLPILTYLLTKGGCRLDSLTSKMESVLIAALRPFDNTAYASFTETRFEVVKCIMDHWMMSRNYYPQELWRSDVTGNSPLHYMMKIVSKIYNPYPNATDYFDRVRELNMEDIKRHFAGNWELVSAVQMIYNGADPWSLNDEGQNAGGLARLCYPMRLWDTIVLLRDDGRKNLAGAIGNGESSSSESGVSNEVTSPEADSEVRSSNFNLCIGDCNDEMADVTFFPCGHRVFCSSCVIILRHIIKRCPTCRAAIVEQTSTVEPAPNQEINVSAASQNRQSRSSTNCSQNMQLGVGSVFGSDDGNQPKTSGNICSEDVQKHPLYLEMEKKVKIYETEVMCVICWDRITTIVFQCGHCCCLECSKDLHECHICRIRIEQRQQLYR